MFHPFYLLATDTDMSIDLANAGKLMLLGMAGIFVVMFIIFIVVKLLGRFPDSKSGQE